jgi:hypothetical protein
MPDSPPKEPRPQSRKPKDDTQRVPTPYADALTKRARVDYETSSDESTAVDEIKLSRAMTITALRARKYTEARAWQQTLSNALRIQVKAEGLDAARDDLMTVVSGSADSRRLVMATAAEGSQPAAPRGSGLCPISHIVITTIDANHYIDHGYPRGDELTAHRVRRAARTTHLRPSKELAAWFGPSYRPSDEPITPDNYEAHPWPSPGSRNRRDAVYNAAIDCLARGYPVWHAVLTIRDWNACHPPSMDLIEMAETVIQAYNTAPIDPPTDLGDAYLRLSEHCSDTMQPPSWLVPGVLPAGQRTALVGRWGSGKSWLALDIAMSTVFGSKFLGDTEAAVRGPVVILDGEGGGLRAINRFNQLRIGRGIPRGPTSAIWTSTGTPSKTSTSHGTTPLISSPNSFRRFNPCSS